MKTATFLFYALVILFAGCVPSLHPLYTDKDLIFEPALLGTWTDGDEQTWIFDESKDPNTYDLTILFKDKPAPLIAHLLKLDGILFLDLLPGDSDLQTNTFYNIHLLRAHTFWRIDQIEPTLQIRAMDSETMEKMLKKDPNLIKHEVTDDRLVLTASTEQLQQFMKAHADDEGLFSDPQEFQRVPDANDPNNN